MRNSYVPAIVMIALATSPVAAQTFRQDVVVTAAATPVELGTVTRTLTIITREQIARLPVHSIADVLRLTASVDVRARGERGVQTDFAVRGANFGQMLVLVDGVRLNDAQSGHHNGDIPVPLDAIERIEILHGPGSSLFGADAFGGTVNVITRRDASPASGLVETGSFGLVTGRGQVGVARGDVRATLAGSVDRSNGFMIERGFKTAGATSRTSFGDRTGILASYLWKDFGAFNFYGGNVPSHEWTNQLLLAGDHRLGSWSGWQVATTLSYRTHGDHFLFDVRRPGVSENRHRSHTALGSLQASRRFDSGSIAAGLESGADWVRSTNLGDHDTRRISGFAEWRETLNDEVQIDGSVRVDRYTEFGTAWSPAAGIGWWPSSTVRLRASAGRAFRVPTFTERYYRDPANFARPEVGAENAWAGEAGIDLFLANDWMAMGTVFSRRDHDVIDWLRPTTLDVWRTYNIRDVKTLGGEISARRTFRDGSFFQAGYTRLDIDAAAVTQLSKYVLDYAPHSLEIAASVQLPAGLRVAPRLEYKHRTRSTGTSDYGVLDLRISRAFGIYELRVDAMNLSDATYQEVLGVAMPGRAATVSLAIRP